MQQKQNETKINPSTNYKITGSKTSLLEKNFSATSSLRDCEKEYVISQDDEKFSNASFSIGKKEIKKDETQLNPSLIKIGRIDIPEFVLKALVSNIQEEENNKIEINENLFKDRPYLPHDVNNCIRTLINNLQKADAPQEIIEKIINSFNLENLSQFPGTNENAKILEETSQDEIVKEHALYILKGVVIHLKKVLDENTIRQIDSIIEKYDEAVQFPQNDEEPIIKKTENSVFVDKPFLPKDVNECIRKLIKDIDKLVFTPLARKLVRKKFSYENLSTTHFKEEESDDDDYNSSMDENLSKKEVANNIKYNVMIELKNASTVMKSVLSKETIDSIKTIIQKYESLLYFPLVDRELSQEELDSYVFEDKNFLPKDVNTCIRSIIKDFNKEMRVSPKMKSYAKEAFEYERLSAPPRSSEEDDSFGDLGISDYDRAINIKKRIFEIFTNVLEAPFLSKETKKQIKTIKSKYKDVPYFL